MTEENLEEKLNRKKEELRLDKVQEDKKQKDKFRNINENIYVRTGDILIIEAGSIWKFAKDKGIYVEDGLLQILGTEEEPVVLQAKWTTWNGIIFRESKLDNIIEYTTIKETEKGRGGGICIEGSKLILEHSIIEKGGGIYIKDGEMSLINDKIDKCNDGGLYCDHSKVKIENTRITENDANSGGGISIDRSEVEINNSNITRNTAKTFGGGMRIFSSKVKIGHTNISENNADRGGGMDIYASELIIDHSNVTGNTAKTYGGGIYYLKPEIRYTNNNMSEIRIRNSSITENTAKLNGGGIYNGNCSNDSKYKIIQYEINNISNNKPDNICAEWMTTEYNKK